MSVGEAVRALPTKWRELAEEFRNGTDIGNAEAACLRVSANELEAALSTRPAPSEQVGASVEDELDFEPDEHHTIADMANVGYSLMQAIKSNCPDYCWGESPAEIVVDLINQRDEAAGIIPGASQVTESVAVSWQVQMADALDAFWNPACNAVQAASYHGPASGSDVVGAIAQGFAAVAARLRDSAPAAPSTARALTAPTIGGAAETGASVPPAAGDRTDG